MSRTTVYFSWDKKEKHCNRCKTTLPLWKFRQASTFVCGPEFSSHYCYICRECESDKAKPILRKKDATLPR